MFAQRAFLIERLKSTRKPLEEVIAQAPADRGIYKNWKTKQIMDHISGWDDVIIEALTTQKIIIPLLLKQKHVRPGLCGTCLSRVYSCFSKIHLSLSRSQLTISSFLNHSAISFSPFSAESDAWVRLRPTSSAKS
jgi:hypothetical protein